MSDDPAMTCWPYPPPRTDGTSRSFDPEWRTETVLALAKGIEAEHAFDRLPILADALEEAGCDDEVLLRHCRECDRHEVECWAMSLVLDRPPPMTPEQVQEMISRLAAARPAVPAAIPAVQPEERESASRGLGLFGWFLILLVPGVIRLFVSGPGQRPPVPDPQPQNVFKQLAIMNEVKLDRLSRELDELLDCGPPDQAAVRRKQVELASTYRDARDAARRFGLPPPPRPPHLDRELWLTLLLD